MRLCIIGLGGVGSAAVNMLVERRKEDIEEIHLVDMDTVERGNIPNQTYTEEDIGRDKVDATKRRIRKMEYRGRIFTYKIDINQKNNEVSSLLKCDLYISAVDNYQSRVNFYYYVVLESENKKRLYIDGGTERFRAHCFYTTEKSPCIFCIRWMFPEEKKTIALCTLRNIPEKITENITEERKKSILISILESERKKEKRKNEQNSASTEHSRERRKNHQSTHRTSLTVEEKTAQIFNEKYKEYVEEEPERKVTPKDVENIDSNILPNFISTNVIIGSIIILIIAKKEKKDKKNFILYSGDGNPVFSHHLLLPDPNCTVCSE